MQSSKKQNSSKWQNSESIPPIELSLSQFLHTDCQCLEFGREIGLSDKDSSQISLAYGETTYFDEKEFVLRLMQLEKKPNGHQVIKCVEFGKESFDILDSFQTDISKLLQVTKMKAIIFQNFDIQVYAMEEVVEDGFLLHFEDRRRRKVSLDAKAFTRLVALKKEINIEYGKFSSRKQANKRKKSAANKDNKNK